MKSGKKLRLQIEKDIRYLKSFQKKRRNRFGENDIPPVKTLDPLPVKTPDPLPVKTPDPPPVKTPDPLPVKTPDPLPVKKQVVKKKGSWVKGHFLELATVAGAAAVIGSKMSKKNTNKPAQPVQPVHPIDHIQQTVHNQRMNPHQAQSKFHNQGKTSISDKASTFVTDGVKFMMWPYI